MEPIVWFYGLGLRGCGSFSSARAQWPLARLGNERAWRFSELCAFEVVGLRVKNSQVFPTKVLKTKNKTRPPQNKKVEVAVV